MNAKNEPTYVVEEVVTQPWIKSRGAKLTAIIAGGVIALGGAFGAGVVIGRHVNFDIDRHFGIQGLGHDGDQDHGFSPNGGGIKGYGGDGQFHPQPPAPGLPTTQATSKP